MGDIRRYKISLVENEVDPICPYIQHKPNSSGDWCKYSDVEKRITDQADTNRLLRRDLDESERRIEELTGISV